MKSPTEVAKEIAEMIKSDPVAARQVKEYIKSERLMEMLELGPRLNERIIEIALSRVHDLESRANNIADEVSELRRNLEKLAK